MSSNRSIIVLIGGGHAAGKEATCNLLQEEVYKLSSTSLEVEIIDMKDYEETNSVQYSSSESSAITVGPLDKKPPLRPSRFDFDKLRQYLLQNLETSDQSPQKLFLVHGLYALYDKQLRDLSQIKVFISSDADTRLIRWITRDVIELKAHNLNYVLNYYLQSARQEMRDFISFTKEFADVIMPRGADPNAVKLILDGILTHLLESKYYDTSANFLRPLDDSVIRKNQFDDKMKFYELN